jgi:hypothetical protein
MTLQNKTQPTTEPVQAFLATVADPLRRADCETVARMMARSTGAPATMWGPAIVGFGRYHYRYDSGREGDSMLVGFSPRKTDLTLYIMPSLDHFADLLPQLGKHKTGKSCLYLKRLADVDTGVLQQVIDSGVAAMAGRRTDR